MRFVLFCVVTLLSGTSVTFAQDAPGAGYHLNGKDLEKFNAMSPTERNAAVNQAQEQLKSMSNEDKQALTEQARSEFLGLSPAEQEQLKSEALQRWQAMSPQEQQELRNTFPAILQGELQPH